MKPPQFIVTVILSLLSLILVVNLIFMGQRNQTLQSQLQQQQVQITNGAQSQQIANNLLQEIARASLKDDKLKDVLAKSGVVVNASPSPSSAPAATP